MKLLALKLEVKLKINCNADKAEKTVSLIHK